MKNVNFRIVFVLILVAISMVGLWRTKAAHHSLINKEAVENSKATPELEAEKKAQWQKAFASLPLSFEKNQGQTDEQVKYFARGSGYSLSLTSREAILTLRTTDNEGQRGSSVVKIGFPGSRNPTQISGVDELSGKSNYFIGSDQRHWRSNVPSYQKVEYKNIYPGINAIFYGNNQRQLEYDFVIAPQSKPNDIRLTFQGVKTFSLDKNGELILRTPGGDLRQHKPVAYQLINGERRSIEVVYELFSQKSVGFKLGKYDRSKELIIDPVLSYSTYLGGTGTDTGRAIALDKDGNAYITGETFSNDFPGASQIQPTRGNTIESFVLKLNPAGSQIVYATWLGGDRDEFVRSIVVDASGNAYVAGATFSTNFPTTTGAFQRANKGAEDTFLTKINPTGTALIYSTLLGGTGSDAANDLAVDSSGNAYLGGRSSSTDLPATGFQLTPKGNSFYKSTNQAGNWTAGGAGLLAGLTNSLTIDPSNPSILYAATVSGVYKSMDGGNQWQQLGAFASPSLNTYQVVVHPTTPTVLFAGVSGGLFKSTDGGASWVQQQVPIQGAPFFFSIIIDPVTPSTMYVGTAAGIYKTVNGGDTWVAANNGLTQFPSGSNLPQVNRLVIDRTAPAKLYAATNRGFFKTVDGGANWVKSQQGMNTNAGDPQIRDVIINSASPETLYALNSGFSTGLYKSTDGAATWTLITTGITFTSGLTSILTTIVSLVPDTVTPNLLYATAPSFGVFKSTDGGTTWSPSNTGLNNLQVSALAVDRNGVVLAATTNTSDGFVAKVNPTGSALSYLTYIGGDEGDTVNAIAVDKDSNAVISGVTSSLNFPTSNPFQVANGGGSDAFIAKLNASGSALSWSTYLGGAGADTSLDLALDSAGRIYVTGTTTSINFPTLNPLQATNRGQNEIFLSRLKADGSGLESSTYLGGTRNDLATNMVLDKDGNIFLTGSTDSSDFPLVAPYQGTLGVAGFTATDAFVIKLNPTVSEILYSTYLGGERADTGYGIAVDAAGNPSVTGNTSSNAFPLSNSIQPYKGASDAFLARLVPGADVSVTMTGPATASLGENLSYTILVTNKGELDATAVKLVDALPAGVTLVSVTPSQGTCTGKFNCNLGSLARNAGATITAVIVAPAISDFNHKVSVSADQEDPNLTNNSAMTNTQVVFSDLAVSNMTTLDRVMPGGVITWLVTVTNKAGNTAKNITLIYSLPTQTTYQNCSIEGGDCGGIAANFVATVPELAVGQSKVIVLTAKVKDGVLQDTMITGSAAVSCLLPDPDLTNNTSQNILKVVDSILTGKANGKIIFTSDRAFSNSTEPSGLYTINPDGTGETFLSKLANHGSPRWSPDGTKLVVLTREEYIQDLVVYVTNPDGSGKVKIADNALPNLLSWSPDSKKILYVGSLDHSLFLVNADGSGRVKLPNSPTFIDEPDWSPDGAKIAYEKDSDIWTMKIDGTEKTNLTKRINNAAKFMKPRWSPDGKRILYERRTNNYYDVWLMNADGSEQTKFLNVQNSTFPMWSPDGTKVAFVSFNNFYVINFDGTNKIELVNKWYNFMSDWQPLPTNNLLPPPINLKTYTLSGKLTTPDGKPSYGIVTLKGPVEGITAPVDQEDGTGQTTGQYSFVRLPEGGNYTVSVTDPRIKVEPLNRVFTNLKASQTGVDFVLTPITYNISGRVVDKQGNGIPRVEINVSRFYFPNVKTDNDGYFSMKNIPAGVDLFIAVGSIYQLVLPSDTGGFFDIANLSENKTIEFVMDRALWEVKGKALDASGNAISGATVTLSGNKSATAATDAEGNYSFANLSAGYSYAVGINKTGITFLPANRDIPWLDAARQINFISGMRVATTVSGASFRRDPIPLGGLVSVFGTDLAQTTQVLDIRPAVYGADGTEVWLEDSSGAEAPMQLLFISPTQINCYMPYFMKEGQGIVKVLRNSKIVSLDILQIARVSPGIFSATADGNGLAAASLIFIKGGERSYGTVATCGSQGCLANPIDVNLYDEAFVEIYGTGVNNDKGAAGVKATIGGQTVPVLYAGTQCCFIGVDQINLPIPKSLAGKGLLDVVITVEGKLANTVKINVK